MTTILDEKSDLFPEKAILRWALLQKTTVNLVNMRTKRRQKPTKINGKTHFWQIPTFQAYTEVYTGLHHTHSEGKDEKTCVSTGSEWIFHDFNPYSQAILRISLYAFTHIHLYI